MQRYPDWNDFVKIMAFTLNQEVPYETSALGSISLGQSPTNQVNKSFDSFPFLWVQHHTNAMIMENGVERNHEQVTSKTSFTIVQHPIFLI